MEIEINLGTSLTLRAELYYEAPDPGTGYQGGLLLDSCELYYHHHDHDRVGEIQVLNGDFAEVLEQLVLDSREYADALAECEGHRRMSRGDRARYAEVG